MNIAPIAACDLDMTIGKAGGLPWHLPADLRFFKRTTMGKPMIMGRRTFESFPGLLPGRPHIVLTRRADFAPDGVEVVGSIDEALEAAQARAGEADEVMVIGGATVYEKMLSIADRLYLTVIHERFGGDTYFPLFDIDEWEIAAADHRDPDDDNAHPYSFVELNRVAPKPVLAVRQATPGDLPGKLRHHGPADDRPSI